MISKGDKVSGWFVTHQVHPHAPNIMHSFLVPLAILYLDTKIFLMIVISFRKVCCVIEISSLAGDTDSGIQVKRRLGVLTNCRRFQKAI